MNADTPAPADTAARSLAHWSEEGRREMEAFYALARLDYELLAKALDWNGLLGALQEGRSEPLRLLDVACGSGKFPLALGEHADLGETREITYDLLDPSAFSLSEAAAVLEPPFTEGARYETTMEDLAPSGGPWDVVWATHALYALEPAKVDDAVARYLSSRAPGGVSFLAQGARGGHYIDVYEAFLEGVRGGEGTPYVPADDLIAAMREQGAEPHVHRLQYEHVVRAEDTPVLEGFLQRCLFDDTVPLEELLEAPLVGEYLRGCHDTAAGVYRFHHEVDCVLITEGATPWTAAS